MIRGSVVLLRKPELPEARKLRYIKAIADTTDRATRPTSQLLAFARRSALQPQIIDARNGVEVLAPMLRKLSGSRIKAIHRIFRRLTQAHVSFMKAESVNGDRVCAATDGGRRQRLDVNCSHPGREINRNHLVAADPGSLEKQLLHSLGKRERPAKGRRHRTLIPRSNAHQTPQSAYAWFRLEVPGQRPGAPAAFPRTTSQQSRPQTPLKARRQEISASDLSRPHERVGPCDHSACRRSGRFSAGRLISPQMAAVPLEAPLSAQEAH